MASTTSVPQNSSGDARPVRLRSPLHSALRIFFYIAGVVLTALLLGMGSIYRLARAPLPQLDGTLSVAGISAPVRVVRDGRGVPTLEASALEDLFFAQGYVTASDRLWQMDVMRRAAGGELSEIIGPVILKMDREERILGLRQAAETAEKKISARDRGYFDAYVRGVNAFIATHRTRLPLEFRILKYAPRPWTVTDSLLIGARMVKDLNHYSYERALEREKILAKLGPELTADLYVNRSWRDRPPTEVRRMDDEPAAASDEDDDDDDDEMDPAGGARVISALPHGLKSSVAFDGSAEAQRHPKAGESEAVPFQRNFERRFWRSSVHGFGTGETPVAPLEDELFRAGSNDWVVSGAHTVSGKPLLSNDMHLNHQMPNLWYAAHLRTKDGSFDVAGVTLPGIPFVIVGHNARIGWGFTNVGPTVEDDFIEEFNAAGEYKTPAGWAAAGHRLETIHVKGAADVTLDVVTTRHGPIITELIPGETRKIALRWTLQDGMGLMFFDVNRARNWEEFRQAFSGMVAPGQNVMYGDVDGHIGYQATGWVPIRAAGDGSLPVSGADDSHEWTGWVPFDQMPHIYDPPGGILATANGRITPDGYKYSISTEWDAPWRTERIYRVLESGKKFAPADMLALQMDISSAYDRFCADKFVYAIDHAPKASERAKRAADILRDWDGRMSADAAAPTIETRARRELVRMLLEPKLGPAASGPDRGQLSWKSYRWDMASVWLENVLTRQPARWLPAGYSDYGALLTAALENVVTQKSSSGAGAKNGAEDGSAADTAAAPADLNQWTWGKYYPLEIDHPVLGKIPLIGRFTGPGLHPLSGSTATVKQVGSDFGPSERVTWDFSNFDQSTLNLVTGESGIFLSPYYMDQWAAWYGGTTFAFPFSESAVEQQQAHSITLEPQR